MLPLSPRLRSVSQAQGTWTEGASPPPIPPAGRRETTSSSSELEGTEGYFDGLPVSLVGQLRPSGSALLKGTPVQPCFWGPAFLSLWSLRVSLQVWVPDTLQDKKKPLPPTLSLTPGLQAQGNGGKDA